jgi:hypothetical protein
MVSLHFEGHQIVSKMASAAAVVPRCFNPDGASRSGRAAGPNAPAPKERPAPTKYSVKCGFKPSPRLSVILVMS